MKVWNVDIYTEVPVQRVYVKAETAKEAEEKAQKIYYSLHKQTFRAKGENLEKTKKLQSPDLM